MIGFAMHNTAYRVTVQWRYGVYMKGPRGPFQTSITINVQNLVVTSPDVGRVLRWDPERGIADTSFSYNIECAQKKQVQVKVRIYGMNRNLVYELTEQKICPGSYSFTWDGTVNTGYYEYPPDEWSNIAPAGLYTFDVEVIANPYDRDAVRSQALTVVPGPVEYLGYDDGGTPEDESDDNLLYYLRWYALYSGRDASYGEIWLYDPDLERVQIWIVPVLQCVVHENCDGLTANPNGEIHGVIISVPVSLMDKAGTYRFVLHFYDDYADSYRNHQIKAALELNATTKPIAYIPDVNGGWLLVYLEPSKEQVSLPFTLKVQLDYSKDKRDYFTILEGVHKGKRASVKEGYLKRNPKYKQQIKLIYYKRSGILKIDGRNEEYKAVMDNPLPNGIYVIQLPDYPHEKGRLYLDRAKRALTWFRIRANGERYLHTGSISAGCLTVTDVKKWDSLYDAIIWCRKSGDDNAHGILEIRD
jgi:hypothetical protein